MNRWQILLETYTLEEILELSDLTPEDVLECLSEQGLLRLPETKPVDLTCEF